MVVGCYVGSRIDYRRVYREVFVSPFDHMLAVSDMRRAGLKKIVMTPLTEEETRSIERLEELERLGGIDERYLHPNKPITDEELESILKEAEEHLKSLP